MRRGEFSGATLSTSPFAYFSFRKHLSILRTPLFITDALAIPKMNKELFGDEVNKAVLECHRLMLMRQTARFQS